VTLTYANIQKLELNRGPIQQMLGIANLLVHTAGGAGAAPGGQAAAHGHRGMLEGIENAEEIRDMIGALLQQYRDAGLGDPEDRRRAAAAPAGAWTPSHLERLREILAEIRRSPRPM
jgi:uncharacterized membrane protein YdbT with pleckstrin-like domain